MSTEKEAIRKKSIKQASDDPYEKFGDNVKGVIKGHVEKIEIKLSAIDSIRSEIKDLKKDARADGFSSKAIDECIRKRKKQTATRLELEQEVQKMMEALDEPTLFDYAEAGDIYTETEADADAEVAA